MCVSYGNQSFVVDYDSNDPEQFRKDVEFAEKYVAGEFTKEKQLKKK